jgi:heme-binding protein
MKTPMRRVLKTTLVALLWIAGIFGAMQLVPYGRTHSNPRIVQEPSWDSPRTRELARRACFDCHSNETRWPWYANVAPMSWVVQQDVENARSVINFSEWNVPYDLASSSGLSVKGGSMPPAKYRMAHPEADLNAEETAALIRGLDATLKPAGQR